jgi:lipoate-protein ligase A
VARRWRLLIDGAGVDEALLASARSGGPPTLRLYGWDAPWLSLGYAQRWQVGLRERCARAGVGLVRRVTGGRAVLHGADLTYAVAAPESALPDGLRATYALLASALLDALAELGVRAERSRAPGASASDRAFDCFSAPAAEELCAAGRKLVGSAQRRGGGGVLQHGSLRLAPDPPLARAAAGLVGGSATSLRELGCLAPLETVREHIADALSRHLGVAFERGVLSPLEATWAADRGEDPPRLPTGLSLGDSQETPPPADRD